MLAQGTTASASAQANIVIPISITLTTNLNFGNVAVNAHPGTVKMDPSGNRTPTGGVTLPAIPGTVTPATYIVSGEPGLTYSVLLPSSNNIIDDGYGNQMYVNGWVSYPSGTGILTGGTDILSVAGRLNVNINQFPGFYTSLVPYDVTVNYN